MKRKKREKAQRGVDGAPYRALGKGEKGIQRANSIGGIDKKKKG